MSNRLNINCFSNKSEAAFSLAKWCHKNANFSNRNFTYLGSLGKAKTYTIVPIWSLIRQDKYRMYMPCHLGQHDNKLEHELLVFVIECKCCYHMCCFNYLGSLDQTTFILCCLRRQENCCHYLCGFVYLVSLNSTAIIRSVWICYCTN